ncbi:outer dense fiber protein 3-like protein 2 [Macrosteles quadrilineatus]|uniref:outer dense fiber protein 3-like protein 2 n=1 Tax=Macrosteles quadrilineatus TaxID=74068 RepID=UPI0023E0CD8A|nr:outer dense fiber protein 3-like protein 2 [Macrosteles quadrilineatus]
MSISRASKGDGPGYYMLPSTLGTSGPSYSFGVRPADASVRKMPGPQSYDVSELTRHGRSSVPSCKLGAKLQHGSWYPKKKTESPGPGAYSPELYGSIQWNCSRSRTTLKETSSVHNHWDQKCSHQNPWRHSAAGFESN